MRIIKVIYNNDTKNCLKLIGKLDRVFIEKYNYDHYKEKKNAIPIMTRHGAKKLPFLVFEDENLEEYAAYWSESKKELTLDLINELLNTKLQSKLINS